MSDNDKKKILITTSTFPKWEMDTTPPFVYELSKRLVDDFQIFILAPYSTGSKKYEKIDGMDIYRYKYWFNSKNNLSDGAILPNLKKNKLFYLQIPFFLLFQFLAIKKIVKKEKINTIHAHWIIPQGFVAVLYKKIINKNIKILCTSHGADIFGLQKFNFLKKWILNNCTRLTVVSNAIKNEALKIGSKINTEVLPMGVDLDIFNPKNYSEEIKSKYNINGSFLLFVGRLSEKKGIKYLIEAMPRIIEKFPTTKLLIIGNGEEKNKLEKLSKTLNLENNIIFTGAIHNLELPKYYATADIFIGPSIITKNGDREGLPVTYMEAMASGSVLIGTNLDGNYDILDHEKTGIMIKQHNSVEISKYVIELLDNKDYREKLIKNSILKIENNYNWKIISKKYKELLK
ncbi:MAG: glycosyltransferase [Patescibacteria group bacterium]|nr:glycosyltransferase [Patescibacteria group bacterium]MDD4304289.1 glycosyltransferase [Patescibacteria group bacterium]MDD4695684.1 glycosyltransferase [Patescibacteria group bacterium]